jgi:hypothetical protein
MCIAGVKTNITIYVNRNKHVHRMVGDTIVRLESKSGFRKLKVWPLHFHRGGDPIVAQWVQ